MPVSEKSPQECQEGLQQCPGWPGTGFLPAFPSALGGHHHGISHFPHNRRMGNVPAIFRWAENAKLPPNEVQLEKPADRRTDLRPLAHEGHAVPREGLVAQRRIGKPEGGVGVAPRDEATHHHRHETHYGQYGSWEPGRLRHVTFAGCAVVVPHADESIGPLDAPPLQARLRRSAFELGECEPRTGARIMPRVIGP